MLILKLALRNLRRHLRKTLLLGALIALGIAALFMANAVFQGTNEGLEASLVRSLTGDAVLAQAGEEAFSLFGSEVPIVSEYEGIPPLAAFTELWPRIKALPSVAAATPVVSGAAQLTIGGYAVKAALFGVDPASYLDVCSDVSVTLGEPALLADRGVMLNAALAAQAEAALGRPLALGEPVLLSMYAGGSFRLREGRLAGVHAYPSRTEALDRVVLADPLLVRALAGYTLGNARLGTEPEAASESFDLDALFSDAVDLAEQTEAGLDLASVEARLADTAERDLAAAVDESAWSFILLAAKGGDRARLERELAALLAGGDHGARLLSWRSAAGMSAQALFALQSAFYVGLGFVALGAVLVITNALVISVLERVPEIGTMRSLGAGAPFVRSLFIAESLLLTGLAALVGVALGAVASAALARSGIALTNALLITLFGGARLLPRVTLGAMLLHLALALAVGALAWIYPVRLAMRIRPVTAMNG